MQPTANSQQKASDKPTTQDRILKALGITEVPKSTKSGNKSSRRNQSTRRKSKDLTHNDDLDILGAFTKKRNSNGRPKTA